MGEPREIGLAALFLAVDATFTTGTELNCSGGSEIGYGVKGHEMVWLGSTLSDNRFTIFHDSCFILNLVE